MPGPRARQGRERRLPKGALASVPRVLVEGQEAAAIAVAAREVRRRALPFRGGEPPVVVAVEPVEHAAVVAVMVAVMVAVVIAVVIAPGAAGPAVVAVAPVGVPGRLGDGDGVARARVAGRHVADGDLPAAVAVVVGVV